MGLPAAVAVNMLDMIGVGPFITLPLLLGTMGGPQAMLGWIFWGAAGAVRRAGVGGAGRDDAGGGRDATGFCAGFIRGALGDFWRFCLCFS